MSGAASSRSLTTVAERGTRPVAKRRIKPKVLLLNTNSERSIARLEAALAFTGKEVPVPYELRQRARAILDILRAMA